jgi:hypothetical protein
MNEWSYRSCKPFHSEGTLLGLWHNHTRPGQAARLGLGPVLQQQAGVHHKRLSLRRMDPSCNACQCPAHPASLAPQNRHTVTALHIAQRWSSTTSPRHWFSLTTTTLELLRTGHACRHVPFELPAGPATSTPASQAGVHAPTQSIGACNSARLRPPAVQHWCC